jgi:hypothetical protein
VSDLQTALADALRGTQFEDHIKRTRKVHARNLEHRRRAKEKKLYTEYNFNQALEIANSSNFRGRSPEEIWDIVERLHNEYHG